MEGLGRVGLGWKKGEVLVVGIDLVVARVKRRVGLVAATLGKEVADTVAEVDTKEVKVMGFGEKVMAARGKE